MAPSYFKYLVLAAAGKCLILLAFNQLYFMSSFKKPMNQLCNTFSLKCFVMDALDLTDVSVGITFLLRK
jgi:hypothetical protein